MSFLDHTPVRPLLLALCDRALLDVLPKEEMDDGRKEVLHMVIIDADVEGEWARRMK